MNVNRCPTCKQLKKRSGGANRRYWLLMHLIADKLSPQGQAYSAETWHTYAKMRFLGADEVKLPNGKTIQIPRSSAELNTAEFNDFATQVEVWASEHNVYLEEMPA